LPLEVLAVSTPRQPGDAFSAPTRSGAIRRPAAVLAVEAGDFLEGRLDRVQEAYERGVRSIQLVHYRVNDWATSRPSRHDTAGSRRSGAT